jgi:hypothetical protein
MPGLLGADRASFLRIGSTAAKANFIDITTGSSQVLSQKEERRN